MTFTAVPSHGRASSKFSTPSFRHGKRVSIEELLKGLAAAAWMAGAIDVIVLVAAMHSREDVAIACLLCVAEEQHRATVIDFCLGNTNEPSLEEYMLSVGGQGHQGGGEGAVHRD